MTITTFEIGGRPCEYVEGVTSGADPISGENGPPIWDGDEVIAAGEQGKDGIWQAAALYLPRGQILLGEDVTIALPLACLILAVGLALVALGLAAPVWLDAILAHMGRYRPDLVHRFFWPAFAILIGGMFVSSASKARTARLMVLAAAA